MKKESNIFKLEELLREALNRSDFAEEPSFMQKIRENAREIFLNNGLPSSKIESWRDAEILKMFHNDFIIQPEREYLEKEIERILECSFLEKTLCETIRLINGGVVPSTSQIHEFSNGVIVGSLKQAIKKYPELLQGRYGTVANDSLNGLLAVNTAMVDDGFFIYVPQNVTHFLPIQVINILCDTQESYVASRNMIILEKNSKLTLFQFHNSSERKRSLYNEVTECILYSSAELENHTLLNIHDSSAYVSQMFVRQEEDSKLRTSSLIFNGSNVKNNLHVVLDGENADADIYGMYLIDNEQKIDNQVNIVHAKPSCTSNQLFKGIVDDNGHSVFNGHILVKKDAQKTQAYQNCRNIVMSDKTTVRARPFLEIYADDVKCSHGATIGQIDTNALFYIMARGISEADAMLLLMYAFVADVINAIKDDDLRNMVDDMVKKRLSGELSNCDQCVLFCSKPKHGEVNIDEIDEKIKI